MEFVSGRVSPFDTRQPHSHGGDKDTHAHGHATQDQRGQFIAHLSQMENLIGHFVMLFLALLFGISFSLLAMRRERHERELLDVRLRLLQAQIEPHFLFNT
jgi:hypothetical protein